MSKWKCEICNSSFENFDARGFDNKIYCPLCYYKKLYKDTELERERLNNTIKQLKECLNIVSPSKEMLEGKYWENEEIERLNKECDTYMKIATKKEKIIKKLEYWLSENLPIEEKNDLQIVLDKLQELKGSDKE